MTDSNKNITKMHKTIPIIPVGYSTLFLGNAFVFLNTNLNLSFFPSNEHIPYNRSPAKIIDAKDTKISPINIIIMNTFVY